MFIAETSNKGKKGILKVWGFSSKEFSKILRDFEIHHRKVFLVCGNAEINVV